MALLHLCAHACVVYVCKNLSWNPLDTYSLMPKKINLSKVIFIFKFNYVSNFLNLKSIILSFLDANIFKKSFCIYVKLTSLCQLII